jgi:hypothetical protein
MTNKPLHFVVAILGVCGAAVVCLASADQAYALHSRKSGGTSGTAGKEFLSKGVVTTVDTTTMTFGCHWKTHDWTYKTTDVTMFYIGQQLAAFSDLKSGVNVRVTYHVVDAVRIADKVMIAAPSAKSSL